MTQSPFPYWAREQLAKIAGENPEGVARRLLEANVAPADYTERLQWKARDYTAQFLPGRANEIYWELRLKMMDEAESAATGPATRPTAREPERPAVPPRR